MVSVVGFGQNGSGQSAVWTVVRARRLGQWYRYGIGIGFGQNGSGRSTLL